MNTSHSNMKNPTETMTPTNSHGTKKRIAYLDFVKVFAMFIVTIGHCAQSLSCEFFPEKIIPNDFFVTIHMPLFMMASGFVLNIERIRETPFMHYVMGKFYRLVIPMVTWYIIFCATTLTTPCVSGVLNTYWYLAALFASLVIIKIFSSFISNNILFWAISLLFVIAMPLTQISFVNFMFPFLLYGYALRRFIDKINFGYGVLPTALIFFGLYIGLWSISHTIYLAPLRILQIDGDMIYSFFLRLLIGITGSTMIFFIAKRFDNTPFIQAIAKYGNYTLIFYTMTTVLNGITLKILSYVGINIAHPLLLDVASIIFTIFQMYIIYIFAKLVERNKIASRLLLGN